MNKKLKIALIVIAVAIAAYLAWKWWSNRQQSIQSPTDSFGTNLNSVAPELVGGSAGPSVGSAPAVSLPVHITITNPTNSENDLDSRDFTPQAIPLGRSDKSVFRQRHSAGVVSGPDNTVPVPESSTTGDRGTSDQEQDNMDEMDASTVSTGMYGTGI